MTSFDTYRAGDVNTDFLLNSISPLVGDDTDEYDNTYSKFDTTKLISLAKSRYLKNVKLHEQLNKNDILSKTETPGGLDFDSENIEENKMDSIFKSHFTRENDIQYVDSRTDLPISYHYVHNNFFLKFQKKDFYCKFTFINDGNRIVPPGLRRIFVPKREDFLAFKDLSNILEKIMNFYKFTKYKEFPFVFYNYCVVLMKSGYDPIQDFLISYVTKYLDAILNSKKKPNVIDIKIRLIARIFSLKNIKVNNFYSTSDVIERNESEDLIFENKSSLDDTIREELIHENHFDKQNLENSWVFDNNFSISLLNNENFNLFISRAIRYSIFLYWQRRKSVKKWFVTWYKKSELMHRESFLYLTWNKYICKKILVNKLYEKYNRNQRRNIIALNHYDHNLKLSAFDNWKNKLQLTYENKERAVIVHKSKYFMKLIIGYDKIEKFEGESFLLSENRLKRHAFNSWNRNRILVSKKKLFNREREVNCIKYFMSKWKSKYEFYKRSEVLSQKFESGVKCGSVFIDWHNQTITRRNEYLDNIRIINLSLKKRYFNTWKKTSLLKTKLYLFKERQEEIMKKFVFEEKLIKQCQYVIKGEKFIQDKNSRDLRRYFKSWNNITEINFKASIFRRNKLLINYFLQLERSSCYQSIDKFYDYKLVQKFIRIWIVNVLCKQYLDHSNRKLIKSFFHKWKVLYLKSSVESEKANEFYSKQVMSKTLKCWSSASVHWKELLTDADIFYRNSKLKHNFIKGLNSKILKTRMVEKEIKDLKNFHLKKLIFSLISDSSNKLKERRLDDGYKSLVIKKNDNMKILFFLSWIDKYNSNIEKETRCDDYIKDKFFRKYSNHLKSLNNYTITADMHYEAFLFKKYLYALINKSNYYFDIRISEENFIQEKEFKMVELIWKLWDMKLMKVRQQNESLKLFKMKSQKNKAKQILQLWIVKYNEKNFEKSYQDILGSLDEDSLIVLSNKKNISPVKSYNNNIQRQIAEQNVNKRQEVNDNSEQLFDYYDDSYNLEDSPLLEKRKREYYNDTRTINNTLMISSTPATKTEYFNFGDTEEKENLDSKHESDRNYNTPSKSRTINMSVLGIGEASNSRSVHIRNKRLESLKKYYNRQTVGGYV